MGGRTTSADSRAMLTFMATTIPKSRRSGRADVAMTATPTMPVSAETMNALPGGRRRRRRPPAGPVPGAAELLLDRLPSLEVLGVEQVVG
jgi:hypothetical protein